TGDVTDTKTLSYLPTEGYVSISLVDPETKNNYDVNESPGPVSNSGDDEHNNYEYIVNLVVQSD
ncbi:MAG: hypothetical protein IJ093_00855, partial [Bacilli bacterium]|nr:hypothetical protein [Bacilli bacterium]